LNAEAIKGGEIMPAKKKAAKKAKKGKK